MTQEQIEETARVYAEEKYPIPDADNIDLQAAAISNSIIAETAFIAGATSRQREIDALTADNERLQKDVAERLKREEIARKIIEEKRKEIDALVAELKSFRRISIGYECTNESGYGISEYKEGCVQNCSICDYYQPIK